MRPSPENLTRTQELILKYHTMDAGDASLVVLSEQNPKAQIITIDRADFLRGPRNREEHDGLDRAGARRGFCSGISVSAGEVG